MRRLVALLLLVLLAGPARADTPAVAWQKWDPALFDRAAREQRYILLHMAAVWCHWCHVMEGTTYRDPAIQRQIAERFIPVRVDQDADPALSYRYENWGWPATIMLDKDGNEIFKRRGYIPPELFGKLLAAVIDDPSALPVYSIGAEIDPNAVALSAERRKRTEALVLASYDKVNGGFGDTHRFIHGDTVEWVLERGRALQRNPDPGPWREAAARTLFGARRLIDPVWGGMFQYSDKLDWSGPHYEKLLNIQRDALRSYVLAYQIGRGPADLAAARDIARWLMEFMRAPDGAFYTSQDADAGALHGDAFYARSDAERRAGAQPPIDRNSYARENGWAIASLAALYDVTGDPVLLEAAVRTFDWVVAHRRAPEGGFGHARAANDDTHLGDTLAIAEAVEALHRSTAERRYLALAAELGEIIIRDHRDPAGGFMVRRPEPGAKGVLARPVRQLDENVATVRLLNLLARQTGQSSSKGSAFRAAAEHGLRHLIALAEDDLVVPGALLADRELAREPAHVTIVGAKDDPAARALYEAARTYPTRYLRIEWLDHREGPLPAADIEYPELPQAAAFACANGACSVPVFTPEEVHRIVAKVDDR
jgi:uncharacterized protein YyaL (SSP411 family)